MLARTDEEWGESDWALAHNSPEFRPRKLLAMQASMWALPTFVGGISGAATAAEFALGVPVIAPKLGEGMTVADAMTVMPR